MKRVAAWGGLGVSSRVAARVSAAAVGSDLPMATRHLGLSFCNRIDGRLSLNKALRVKNSRRDTRNRAGRLTVHQPSFLTPAA